MRSTGRLSSSTKQTTPDTVVRGSIGASVPPPTQPKSQMHLSRMSKPGTMAIDPATRALCDSNYLWLTALNVAYALVRFLQIVRGRAGRGHKSESPTQEMLRDVPFVLNLVVWVIVVVAIVYQLRPGAQ